MSYKVLSLTPSESAMADSIKIDDTNTTLGEAIAKFETESQGGYDITDDEIAETDNLLYQILKKAEKSAQSTDQSADELAKAKKIKLAKAKAAAQKQRIRVLAMKQGFSK